MHGGGPNVSAGKPLDRAYVTENVALVQAGCVNLAKHLENIKLYGVNVVVAINMFASDTQAEVNAVRNVAMEAGAFDAVVCTHYAHGGAGAVDLGVSVQRGNENHNRSLQFLYPLKISMKDEINLIAKSYGAAAVEYSEQAEKQIETYTLQGFSGFTNLHGQDTVFSFTYCFVKRGSSGFTLPIRDVRANVGAGFVYPLTGTMSTMPGLPTRPCFFDIDVDTATGRVYPRDV